MAFSWQPHKKCYYSVSSSSDCDGKIINAHTVQKSGGLKKIAANGHVRYFKPSISNLFKNKGKLECEIDGIGKASTFFGFCKKHDTELFSPIENYYFKDCEEHAQLMGYRAVCRELYAKEDQKLLHIELDKILAAGSELNFHLSMQRKEHLSGINLSIKEITKLKERLESNIVNKSTQDIKFLSIRTNDITEYMCCGAFIPELSFDGNKLHDLSTLEELEGHVSLNIFASDQDGVILFQWLGGNPEIEEFLSSLLSKKSNEIPDFITNATFEFLENTFISPSWWNKLSNKQKKLIQKKVMTIDAHALNCLTTENVGNIKWEINSIATNVRNLFKYNT
ncbi:Putative uncharacterized protein [Moritella viscosa]|uniref:hypothetical protein n=1 Tax=Moritella viscosa TaxID=80854 RepID=UPI00050917AF|nr:hypothetical protein [Moritella viscosa]CED58353.1 putative uncharacterized protein [Moritella viscosa]SHN95944.1 Putative uncharacterized protein [Moritella viscosa]SHO19275.1 Putative uncharacterized protein [Moritella viscosa]